MYFEGTNKQAVLKAAKQFDNSFEYFDWKYSNSG